MKSILISFLLMAFLTAEPGLAQCCKSRCSAPAKPSTAKVQKKPTPNRVAVSTVQSISIEEGPGGSDLSIIITARGDDVTVYQRAKDYFGKRTLKTSKMDYAAFVNLMDRCKAVFQLPKPRSYTSPDIYGMNLCVAVSDGKGSWKNTVPSSKGDSPVTEPIQVSHQEQETFRSIVKFIEYEVSRVIRR